nr:hypothetical protein Iba_chr01cCG6100 [Ipomoea batatas]
MHSPSPSSTSRRLRPSIAVEVLYTATLDTGSSLSPLPLCALPPPVRLRLYSPLSPPSPPLQTRSRPSPIAEPPALQSPVSPSCSESRFQNFKTIHSLPEYSQDCQLWPELGYL